LIVTSYILADCNTILTFEKGLLAGEIKTRQEKSCTILLQLLQSALLSDGGSQEKDNAQFYKKGTMK
jgi:hypothetical protein